MKIVLLEDDEGPRVFFKKLLYEIPEVDKVMDTSSGHEAIKLSKTQHPDLIILDIELNDVLNGLEVAKCIYEFDNEAYFLFLTGHPEYAVSSFAVHPFSYILKPIIIEEFKTTINEIGNKVKQRNTQNYNIFIIKSGNEHLFVHQDEIIFIEVKNKVCIIHAKSGKWSVYKSLNEIKQQLNDDFIRVHRSFIVNAKKIKCIREIWDRTYEIEFFDYSLKAQMSRNEYYKNLKRFILLPKRDNHRSNKETS